MALLLFPVPVILLLVVTSAAALKGSDVSASLLQKNSKLQGLTSVVNRPPLFLKKKNQKSITSLKAETRSCNNDRDIFVLSFDGVIASTARYRAELALEVALNIWPHLQGLLLMSGDNASSATEQWLINKMTACAYVTRGKHNDGLLGCDEVLLARLLLEEQALDAKKSMGKKGKYASKFHPSSSIRNHASEESEDSSTEGTTNRGSRPLTVGEICENWNTGGCLRETLRTRYNISGKDPLPIIREEIQTCLAKKTADKAISIHPCVKEALFDCRAQNVYILLSHIAYAKSALEILSDLHLQLTLIDDDTSPSFDISTSAPKNGSFHPNTGLTILANSGQATQVDLIESLMKQAPDGSNFFVVHSSAAVLHDAKNLLNGESPYTMKAARKTRIGNRISMALFLPTWADCTDPKQYVNAEMDPWLTLIDETNFLELLSAKVLDVS